MMDSKIVLFSGYARLPSGTVAAELHGIMGLVILVDIKDGAIVDVECTLSTRLAEKFIASILVGKRLTSDPADLIEAINDVYQGAAKKAIVTSLRIVVDKYQAYLAELHKQRVHQPA